MSKNFKVSENTINDFTITGLEEGHIFSEPEIGEKEITITFKNNQIISFPIYIYDDPLGQANFRHYFSSADFKTGKDVVSYQSEIDGYPFTISYGKSTTASLTKNSGGIRIGSSSSSIGSLTLESDYQLKDANAIVLQGNCASGETPTVDFYLNNQKIASQKMKYVSGSFSSLIQLVETLTGKPKIVISNFSKAIYLKAIGFSF